MTTDGDTDGGRRRAGTAGTRPRAPRSKATAPAGAAGRRHPCYLVRGDDPSLVGQAVRDLVGDLVGDLDPGSVVEEFGGGGQDLDLGGVVDALTTPPLLSALRIVVVRDAGRLVAADAARLAACLTDPVPGVVLVVAAGGGSVPAGLAKALEQAGAVVDTTVGTGRARSEWLARRVRDAPVRLDGRAVARLDAHVGDDVGRLRGLLDTLAAAYGPGARVGEAELEPFLGQEGGLAPWELTDALGAGDEAAALRVLHRLLGPSGMHPLAVLTVLHRHYETMLRLDGAPVATAEEAAALLGARSVYPVKKAMEQGRRLGSARLGRAVILLAEADLDLRGRSALAPEVVLEILVARLARLAAAARGGRR